MTGNTWDWTSSLYTRIPMILRTVAKLPVHPRPPGGAWRVWYLDRSYARASYRFDFAPDYRAFDLGLRVVRSSQSCRSSVHGGRVSVRMLRGVARAVFCHLSARVSPCVLPVSTGGAPATARRVVRGGSWNNDQVNARASYRNDNAPDNRNNNLGLRVVRSSHILIPLMAQPGGGLRIRLLRACSPAWLARAVLPVLAADYGLRPEAKVIKMAQVESCPHGLCR